MDSVKEKLVELLWKASALVNNELPTVEQIADHLIANGVTVQDGKDNNVPAKWISVKNRLPEGECLAASMLTGPAYGEMLVGYVAEASNWDTGYECESDGEILPNVTHWMPLPQPPKGE